MLLSAGPSFAATITIDSVDWGRGGVVNFLENGTPFDGYAGAIPGALPWRNEDRVAWLYDTQLATINSAVLGEALQLAF